MPKVISPVDFGGTDLRSARAHELASAPAAGAADRGLIYFDTTLGVLRYWTGAEWVDMTEGQQGPQGEPGLVWRGPWVYTTVYDTGDVVEYNGSSYVATAPNEDTDPPLPPWELLANVGDEGPQGPPGNDAVHTYDAPGTSAPGDTATEGAASSLARSDHRHGRAGMEVVDGVEFAGTFATLRPGRTQYEVGVVSTGTGSFRRDLLVRDLEVEGTLTGAISSVDVGSLKRSIYTRARTTDQSLSASTWTRISLPSTVNNYSAAISGSFLYSTLNGGRIRVPTSGLYLLKASVSVHTTTTTNRLAFRIVYDGGSAIVRTDVDPGSTAWGSEAWAFVELAAWTYVGVDVYCANYGGNITAAEFSLVYQGALT